MIEAERAEVLSSDGQMSDWGLAWPGLLGRFDHFLPPTNNLVSLISSVVSTGSFKGVSRFGH